MSDGVTSQVTPTRAPRLVTRGRKNGATVTKEGLAAIERLARNGASDGEIARQIGVSRDTLRLIRQRDPAVDEAMAAGRARLDQEFVDRFVQWSRDGHVVAAIFFCKSRLSWLETGANAPGIQVNNTTINLSLPAPMSDEQFRALLSPPKEEIVIDAETIR